MQTLPEAEGRGETILEETISRMKEMIIDTMMSARVMYFLFRNFSVEVAKKKSLSFLAMTS